MISKRNRIEIIIDNKRNDSMYPQYQEVFLGKEKENYMFGLLGNRSI